MDAERSTRDCPYCKEQIKADAIKCKHCGARVAPEHPPHGGTCPYCKEAIHPDAVRCKHCRSTLTGATTMGSEGCSGCGRGAGQAGRAAPAGPLGTGPVLGSGPWTAARRSFATNGPLGFDMQRWPLVCTSWCVGPTLVCECRVPGTIYGSIFPCGTCIDDPTILT